MRAFQTDLIIKFMKMEQNGYVSLSHSLIPMIFEFEFLFESNKKFEFDIIAKFYHKSFIYTKCIYVMYLLH